MPVVINGSTGISGNDGTAAVPTIQGTDTNTGMFFPAADQIAFAEGGTEVMRINASGNVGIGTSSPSGRLNVSGGRAFFAPNGEVYAVGVGFNQTRVNGGQVCYVGATDSTAPDLLFCNAAGLERMRVTDAGNFQFNSGYGSVATAFGCRAWVNFNGTGTIAIRASGNVSSITDNGPGSYGVNFATAMPDASYACQISIGPATTGFFAGVAERHITGTLSTSSAAFTTADTTTGLVDTAQASVAIFR